MVIRYAFLVTLAASSVWAVITMSASRGQMLLVDVGQSGTNVSFWLLGEPSLPRPRGNASAGFDGPGQSGAVAARGRPIFFVNSASRSRQTL